MLTWPLGNVSQLVSRLSLLAPLTAAYMHNQLRSRIMQGRDSFYVYGRLTKQQTRCRADQTLSQQDCKAAVVSLADWKVNLRAGIDHSFDVGEICKTCIDAEFMSCLVFLLPRILYLQDCLLDQAALEELCKAPTGSMDVILQDCYVVREDGDEAQSLDPMPVGAGCPRGCRCLLLGVCWP